MSVTAADLKVRFSSDGAEKVKGDLQSVGDAVAKSGQATKVVGGVLAGFGGLVAGGFALAERTTIAFGREMANVNSIAQVGTGELNKLSDSVLKISSATGRGPADLAAGLYNVYSVGFKGADALNILTLAAKDANAGLSDTATTTGVLTGALNAYGAGADHAQEFSDVLFQEVNDGANSFNDLARNMAQTLPLASSMGVSIQELASGYALLTTQGIPAAQAETDLAALMRAGLSPTKAMTQALNDHGYASVQDIIATKGFTGYLQFLQEASGGTTEGMFKLIGSQEGVAAALALTGKHADAYTKELERMNHASDGVGATQKAMEKQMQSTAFKMQQLSAAVQVLQIRMTAAFTPAINAVVDGLRHLIEAFVSLPVGMQKAISIVLGLVGALSLLSGGFLLALPKILEIEKAFKDIGGLTGIFGKLRTGIAAAMGPLTGMLVPLLAIAAAAGLIYLAYKTNFLHVGDLVNDLTKHFLASFKQWRQFGLNPVSAALEAFNSSLIAVFGNNAITRGIDTFARQFDVLSKYIKAVLIDGDTFNDWLTHLPKPLQSLARGIGITILSFQRLFDAFRTGGIIGGLLAFPTFLRNLSNAFASFMNAIAFSLDDLGKKFPGIQNITDALAYAFYSLGLAAQHVGEAFKDLLTGDLAGVFEDLHHAADRVNMSLTSVGAAITAIGTNVDGLLADLQLVVALVEAITGNAGGWVLPALDWALFIARLEWSAFVSALGWADFITILAWNGFVELLDWAVFLTPIAWDTFIDFLNWGAFLVPIAWDGFIEILDWALFITPIVWSSFVATLDWFLFVTPFAWSAFIATLEWSTFLVPLAWDAFVTSLDWELWLVKLTWDAFVTTLDWAVYLTKLEWSAFVSALDWAVYVAKVDWSAFITTLDWSLMVVPLAWGVFVATLDWGVYVAKLTWDIAVFSWDAFVSVLDWGVYVAKLVWTPFVTVLDWTAWVVKVNWNAFITAVDLTEKAGKLTWETFVTAVDLTKNVVALAWATFVTAVDLTKNVTALAWSTFVTALTSWDSFIPDISWGDFIPHLSWPSPGDILNAITSAVAGNSGPVAGAAGETGSTGAGPGGTGTSVGGGGGGLQLYNFAQNLGGLAGGGIGKAIADIASQATNAATAVANLGAALAALVAIRAVVTITGDNSAALTSIGGAVGALTAADGLSATDFMLGDNSNAVSSIGESVGVLAAADGLTATDFMLGDNSDALDSISRALGSLAAADGRTALDYMLGDNSSALGSIGAALGALGAADGSTATTFIDCVNNVPGAAAAALNALASVAGATATATINVVTTGLGAIPHFATGGIVGAASGMGRGSIVMVGERGPELAYLPNGTYVQPHGASMAAMRSSRGSGSPAPVQYITNHYYAVTPNDLRHLLEDSAKGAAMADAYSNPTRVAAYLGRR